MSSDDRSVEGILQVLMEHIHKAHPPSAESVAAEHKHTSLMAKLKWLNGVATRIAAEQSAVTQMLDLIQPQPKSGGAVTGGASDGGVTGGSAAAASADVVTGGAVTTNGATLSVTGGNDATVGGSSAKATTLGSKTGGKGKGSRKRKSKKVKVSVTKKKSKKASRKKKAPVGKK